MKHVRARAALVAAVVAAFVAAPAATAGDGLRHGDGAKNAVFAQTNELSGNRIAVYDRADDGTLAAAGSYATGGTGGTALPGTESDHLATQGSLIYDSRHSLLCGERGQRQRLRVPRRW